MSARAQVGQGATDRLTGEGLSLNPVVVLGTFRGGTSCLATALSHLGVFLGNESDFQAASEQNPGGFWELREMQDLNARALLVFGMDYFRAGVLPVDWLETPGAEEVVEEMRKLLRSKFSGHERWGWKEPSTSLLLPLYKEALRREKLEGFSSLIVVRHPLSVAASQKSRYSKWGYKAESTGSGEMPPLEERTIGLWVHSTLSALRDSRNSKSQVIFYEEFLKDPMPYIERISDLMLEGKPTAEQRKNAAASVDPQLSHSRHTVEDIRDWPPIVGMTYDLASRLNADPAGTMAGSFDEDIENLFQMWKTVNHLTRPMELPAAQMHFVWLNGENQERASHQYIPTGGWQLVRTEISAPPNATVQIDPCQLPCRMWIRKAVWRVNGAEYPAALKGGPGGVMDRFGMVRLSVFGPAALLALTPAVEGKQTLELEIRVESGETTLREMVTMLGRRQGSSRPQASAASHQAGSR